MEAAFYGPMDPVYPCRRMHTRHCPAVYRSVCGTRPCARFESEDITPWKPELTGLPGAEPKEEGFLVPLLLTAVFLAYDKIRSLSNSGRQWLREDQRKKGTN